MDLAMRCAVLLAGLLLAIAPAASAHVEKRAGPYTVTLGWGTEPPVSGFENSVEVEVADASGDPVEVRAGALEVEVSYAGAVTTLPLVPGGESGLLRAVIVPTRPGTYGFHVTGSIGGRQVDTEAACSEATFECVADAAEVQFPAKDPSTGQLAERVERGLPRAEKARDEADGAHTLAIAALAVAALALIAAGMAVARSRRRA